jgi:hypothetical protein
LTKCKANNNQNNKMSFSPTDRGVFLLNTGESSFVAGQGLGDGIVATSAVEFESHFEETDRLADGFIVVKVPDHKDCDENLCQHGADDQEVTESQVASHNG